MHITIANNIKTTISQTKNTMEYLKFVDEHFHSIDKPLTGTLMAQLTIMEFDRSQNMREHAIKITNIEARIKTLHMTMDESFMVQFIINLLPSKYKAFEINYNTMKDK